MEKSKFAAAATLNPTDEGSPKGPGGNGSGGMSPGKKLPEEEGDDSMISAAGASETSGDEKDVPYSDWSGGRGTLLHLG